MDIQDIMHDLSRLREDTYDRLTVVIDELEFIPGTDLQRDILIELRKEYARGIK